MQRAGSRSVTSVITYKSRLTPNCCVSRGALITDVGCITG